MDLATLQPWGIYASMVAVAVAVAVAVSVIGLSFQVRINTRSLRSYSYSRALDRLAAVQSRLGSDAALSELFARGTRDTGKMTNFERIRFTWVLYEIFGAFEFIHDEAGSGALPRDVWKRWDATLAWWLSLPGVVEWWQSKPAPFNPDFSAHVDRLVENPAHDPASAQRWQTFLEGGEPRARSHSYVVVNVAVRDPERYKEYVKAATPTVAAYGGKYIVRGGRAERLEGSVAVNRIVVLEFPSYAQAKDWYESADYRAARAIRQSCSTGDLVLVEGLD
jgi:uncharacterized protein (DUF1330 family)